MIRHIQRKSFIFNMLLGINRNYIKITPERETWFILRTGERF